MILYTENKNLSSLKSSPLHLDSEISLVRVASNYEDLSVKFTHKEKIFKREYGALYANRINSMTDAVCASCRRKWGKEVSIRRLSEVSDLGYEKCVIIGTIFKDQELKPNILKELSLEFHLIPQPSVSNYVSSSDQIILEDGIQRILLLGSIDVNKLVTGIVIGVLGVQTENKKFKVEDFVFPTLNINIERPIENNYDDSYILMVSGLSVGEPENILNVQLLIDWVNGELGSPFDQQNQSKICRVIIAGNSLKKSKRPKRRMAFMPPDEDVTIEPETVDNMKLLDELLSDLVKSVPVDILPGEFDPSNHALPQQPMLECVFPKCLSYQLHRVTNPYECIIQGRRVLGTSGQPINDIRSLTDFTNDMNILESTLQWSHLAPTAPDTLACYPYYEKDPFIISEQPDIYFAGNVSCFETKIVHLNDHPVRLVCLPVFAESQTCALVNLKNLECSPLHFKIFKDL